MAQNIFIIIATVIFGINLFANITLLATTKHESFPLGNVIGVFFSMALFIFGMFVLIT